MSMASSARGVAAASASDPLFLDADQNFDEDSIEGLLDAEDMQDRRLRERQQQRLLEDVDYWRKRAGWYDDDESMLEYNQGVYDTFYSLDDEYDPETASGNSSGGGAGSKKGLSIAFKALGVIAGVGVLVLLVRTIIRRRSASVAASDKTKSLTSDDEGGNEGGRSGRSKSRSGSASRSSSRHRRSSSRARSKSVSGSGRSRSKSVSGRSRSGRSRSRSRRKSGNGENYDLMGDEEEARSQRTSRSSRSRSRSGRTRSRSKARSSRHKEEMLV